MFGLWFMSHFSLTLPISPALELNLGLIKCRLIFRDITFRNLVLEHWLTFQIGRMGQTDDEIQQNVLAAVKKLASHAPGEWANIQSLSLKLERTTSIPIYVKMSEFLSFLTFPVFFFLFYLYFLASFSWFFKSNLFCYYTDSLNEVKAVKVRPLFPGKPVSGTLTTVPGKCITVFPDGTVTATNLNKKRRKLVEEVCG